jgi:hypothetical protein
LGSREREREGGGKEVEGEEQEGCGTRVHMKEVDEREMDRLKMEVFYPQSIQKVGAWR